MNENAAAQVRQRTMAKQAMRKLSETELHGLGLALTSLERCESVLLTQLITLATAARHEDRTRRNAGHPRPGPIVLAFHAAREVAHAIGRAKEEVTPIVAQRPGRINKGGRPRRDATA